MFVCVSVFPSIFAFGARTAGPIRTSEYSFDAPEQRKTMVPVTDRSVARGTCQARSRKSLQKLIGQRCKPNQRTDSAQTWLADRHHGSCGGGDGGAFLQRVRHLTRDLVLLHFAPERLARLGRERHRSTRTDDGKIVLPIVEGSWVRSPSDAYRGRELNLRF